MIVKGVQRPRIQKRSSAERILFAGFFLALSTQTVSHQDAVTRFQGGVGSQDRWQTHIVARSIVDQAGAKRWYASLIGPGVDDGTATAIDPLTTGSVSSAASINRIAKADILAEQPERTMVAGAFDSVDFFNPAKNAGEAPQMAFVIVPKAETGTRLASTEAPAAETHKAEIPALVAYAPSDDAHTDDAPFDAVMAKSGKGAIVLQRNIPATHAWVNSAIPANARSKKEKRCLADAIYFEARSEPERGRIAVAQVVLNRLKNPAYPNTICSVVYQNASKRNRCQFSFACDGIKERINDKSAWAKAEALTEKILKDDRTLFLSEVGASTHYHANYVRPRWSRQMKRKKKIGRHIFYQTYKGGWS